MKDEIRYYDFKDESRELAPHAGEGRTIEGYAIVFNKRSRVLYDERGRKFFEEVVEPSAVSEDFLRAQDIKLLFNHDKNFLLGRSVNGEGTLSFNVDEYGVRYSCEMPNTTAGNDVLELVKRGDLYGCSFAFHYAKDGYKDERGTDGIALRTIKKFACITDMSVVVDPAYLDTMVSARSFEEPEVEEPKVEEEPKQEPKEEPRQYGPAEDLINSSIQKAFALV